MNLPACLWTAHEEAPSKPGICKSADLRWSTRLYLWDVGWFWGHCCRAILHSQFLLCASPSCISLSFECQSLWPWKELSCSRSCESITQYSACCSSQFEYFCLWLKAESTPGQQSRFLSSEIRRTLQSGFSAHGCTCSSLLILYCWPSRDLVSWSLSNRIPAVWRWSSYLPICLCPFGGSLGT